MNSSHSFCAKFKDSNVSFNKTSITFYGNYDFVVYLKPYLFFLDSKTGIYIQEKDTKDLYIIEHPYKEKTLICKSEYNFIGVIDSYLIFYDTEYVYFMERINIYNAKKYKIPEHDNLILYQNCIFAMTDASIMIYFFENNDDSLLEQQYKLISEKNLQSTDYSVKIKIQTRSNPVQKRNNIFFYMDFLVVDNMVFYGHECVSEYFHPLQELLPFQYKIIEMMRYDEKIYTYRKLFLKKDFLDIISKFRYKKDTYHRWDNLFSLEMLKPEEVILNPNYQGFIKAFLSIDLLPDDFKKYASLFSGDRSDCIAKFGHAHVLFDALKIQNNSNKTWHYIIINKLGNIANHFYSNEKPDHIKCLSNLWKEKSLTKIYRTIRDFKTFMPCTLIILNQILTDNQSINLNKKTDSDLEQKALYVKEAVDLLDDMEICCLEYDENDLLKKRNKAFITRQSANLGKCYLFYGIGNYSLPLDAKSLLLRIKTDAIENIETPEYVKKWADFIFATNYTLLALGNDPYEDENILKYTGFDNITAIPFCKSEHTSALAGAIFALGLTKKVNEEIFCRYIDSKNETVVFSTILGYALSHKTTHTAEITSLIYKNIKNTAPFAAKLASILGMAIIYEGKNNTNIASVIFNEHIKTGAYETDNVKGNKIWYDESYKIYTLFALSLSYNHESKFLTLQNTYHELLLNGIIFSMSGNRKVLHKFDRPQDCKPEELFYSALFSDLITFEANSYDIIKKIHSCEINSINMAYKVAGKIFYISFRELLNHSKNIETERNIFDYLYNLCLESEAQILHNDTSKIIFDYTLISLCLIYNGTCDPHILRILRRQIQKTRKSKNLTSLDDFLTHTETSDTQYGITFGDMLKYKMCIGILCLGHGKARLKFNKRTIFSIISAFYINFPVTQNDQKYFLVFRYLLYFSVEQSGDMHTDGKKDLLLQELFTNEFAKMDVQHKKISLDLLASYFESNKPQFDIEYFKKAYCDFYANQ